MKRMLFSVAVFSLLCSGSGMAQGMGMKGPSGRPTAREASFVASISKDLRARFGTTAQAAKAGYVRFTDEDDTGAISWANGKWNSTDPKHPSELWYDVNGRLIGADYTVPQNASPAAPRRWGIDPRRWQTIGAHVHYGVKQPDGSIKVGAIGRALTKAGGSIAAPTKRMLVSAGVAKSTKDIAFVLPFPAIWDLQVWVIPNANGAFAEANPSVKAQHAMKMMMDQH